MPLPDLTRRRDLARPLNADEFDADIDNFDQRLTAIEDNPPAAVSISNITAAGNQMTITLSDATTFNLTMPYRRLNPHPWATDESMALDDIFPINGELYLVTYAHVVTADEFVAGANDGLGHDYYFKIVPSLGNSLPEGGSLGEVLFKLSGVNFAVGWRFLDAIYVTFSASSDSALSSDNVADALEELEARIATAVAGVAFDAIDVSYSPSSASGLASTNVGDALDELGERVTGFTELSGAISPTQARVPLVPLGTVSGSVSLDPDDGEVFSITASGAITLNATSAPEGARVTLIVTTSGTSSYNITFGANFKSQGVLATGTVTGKTFSIVFDGDGVNLVEAGARGAAM